MKTLNIFFEDEEYDSLIKLKKNLSWREFILTSFNIDKKKKKDGE